MSTSTSIIIPTFNGIDLLPTCLNAIKTQTLAPTEVLLVDDGSTDNSINLVKQNFPWVTIVENEHNIGFVKSINKGLSMAQGEIVISLNNDTEVSPTWLAALVQAFDQYTEAGIAASKIRLFDKRQILHSAGDGFSKNGVAVNRGVWEKDEGQFDDDQFIFGACGGAVAYRRTMLNEIGAFDEDLFMYCEDVDLNWRAQLAGYRCIFVPDALVYHHLSATGGGTLASYYTGRNTILVLIKSVPAIVLRKHAIQIIKAQLQIAYDAIRAWRGAEARARLKGQAVGLLSIPRWLKKRQPIQSSRQVSNQYLESLLQ